MEKKLNQAENTHITNTLIPDLIFRLTRCSESAISSDFPPADC